MSFIIETIVSTVGEDGRVNFAPMGVIWELPCLVIRPFVDTVTYRNLRARREGVVNLTDNVLIFARSALTDAEFPSRLSRRVHGAILDDACAYYEVMADEIDEGGDRASIHCRVVGEGRVRPFLGFNRARNAVIEAAILATRLRWLPVEDVVREFQHCAQIVEKTGGDQERAALEFIERHVNRCIVCASEAPRA